MRNLIEGKDDMAQGAVPSEGAAPSGQGQTEYNNDGTVKKKGDGDAGRPGGGIPISKLVSLFKSAGGLIGKMGKGGQRRNRGGYQWQDTQSSIHVPALVPYQSAGNAQNDETWATLMSALSDQTGDV